MVALQIRDVPEDVHQMLADRARERGQSLQAFLLSLVENEAHRSRNLALLTGFAGRNDGSAVSPSAAAEAVDRARRDRDRKLGGGPGSGAGGDAG